MLATGETAFHELLTDENPPQRSEGTGERPRESPLRPADERVERQWRRLSYTGSIAGVAVIITWLGVWLIRRDDVVGLLLTSIATLLSLVTFRHMGELAEAQKTSLRTALSRPTGATWSWSG